MPLSDQELNKNYQMMRETLANFADEDILSELLRRLDKCNHNKGRFIFNQIYKCCEKKDIVY